MVSSWVLYIQEMVTLPDLDLLYPDRENDVSALLSRNSASSKHFSFNYALVGNKIGEIAKDGVLSASEVITDAVINLFDWIKDFAPNIDQQWLEDLGRDYTPMWGADSWHPFMALDGYVDRYKAAAETVGIGLALYAIRTISGKIGLSGMASFAGGQYSSWKQRNYRKEIKDLLAESAEDADLTVSTLYNNFDRTKARDDSEQDALAEALRALADNSKYRLLGAAKKLEDIS